MTQFTSKPEVEIWITRCQEPTSKLTSQGVSPHQLWKHPNSPLVAEAQSARLGVGCGGNGSAIAGGLPYLHQALLAYGHPEGIHVALLDPDVISPTNCVPQPFSQSEIGLYKSVVLTNRLNMFWGLDWEGMPERLDTKRRLDAVDIVIGCVDTRKARAAIAESSEDWSEVDYWLDLGNNADRGQFCPRRTPESKELASQAPAANGLRTLPRDHPA